MLRVLHVVGAMNRAGAETFLMNLYRCVNRDEIQFDFLVNSDAKCDYDEEIESLGGIVYHIPRYLIANQFSYKAKVREFFREHGEHLIVHGHIGSSAPIYLQEATKAGRFCIAHSHSYSNAKSISDLILKANARRVRGRADYYMACSAEAAIDRFGEEIASGANCSIVKNGITVDAYCRDPSLALNARKKLGIPDVPVICHIGRFAAVKNHPFLIEVFRSVKKTLPNAILLLAGRGEEEESVRSMVRSFGLGDSVRFLGVRDDVADVLRASDLFCFPSFSEGLGIACIEAQATGLPCVLSEGIPDLAVFSGKSVKIPLGMENHDKWVDACIDLYCKYSSDVSDCVHEAKVAGFDIIDTAEWLSSFYMESAR